MLIALIVLFAFVALAMEANRFKGLDQRIDSLQMDMESLLNDRE